MLSVHLTEIGDKKGLFGVDLIFSRIARGIYDTVSKMQVGMSAVEGWQIRKKCFGLPVFDVHAGCIAKERGKGDGFLEIYGCCWAYIYTRHCFRIYSLHVHTCFFEKKKVLEF